MSLEQPNFEKPPEVKAENEEEFKPLISKEIEELNESGCIEIHEGGGDVKKWIKFEGLPEEEQHKMYDSFERRNKELAKLRRPKENASYMDISLMKYLPKMREKLEELEKAEEQFKKEFSNLSIEEQNRRVLRELELEDLDLFKNFQESSKKDQKEWLERIRNAKLDKGIFEK